MLMIKPWEQARETHKIWFMEVSIMQKGWTSQRVLDSGAMQSISWHSDNLLINNFKYEEIS